MSHSSELNHEHYEELCALAALGQIPLREFEELQAHLRSCAACRTRHTEFLEILHEHLPLLDDPQDELFVNSPNITFHDSSYKKRFLERAANEGIKFSDEVLGKRKKPERSYWRWLGVHSWFSPRFAFPLVVLVLGLVVGAMGHRLRENHSRQVLAVTEIARLNEEVARLQRQVQELSELETARTEPSGPGGEKLTRAPSQGSPNASELQRELVSARHDYATAEARSRSLEAELQKTSSELALLQEELVAIKSKSPGADKLREAELALRQTTEELGRIRQERAVDATTISTQQAQIRELNEKLYAQTATLEREREQLATGRDIRDLMGARSLHIIDVADVDSKGTKRPFGRVFYTEGKSLIFYAYDLEKKKKSLETFSFQAWGQRESKAGSVQSLGVFFPDDQTQNRWVLRYDDPSVLAEIDSVFVTVEPGGGSMKPRGQQLMYAYLRANPNHP